MNCDQACLWMASGRPPTPELLEHLRSCAACSELNEIGAMTPEAAVNPATEQRIVAAITSGLAAVRPLAPAWVYVLALVAASLLVVAVGASLLGLAGWKADTPAQRVWFTAGLAGGIALCAVMISRLMVPAALLPVPLRVPMLVSAILLGAGSFLYPLAYYDHFARAVVTCLSIGLGHAIVLSAIVFWIVRRGEFLSRAQVVVTVAFTGGLTGAAVLFFFCPHRDLGHIGLAHLTVPFAAAALAFWAAHRLKFCKQ